MREGLVTTQHVHQAYGTTLNEGEYLDVEGKRTFGQKIKGAFTGIKEKFHRHPNEEFVEYNEAGDKIIHRHEEKDYIKKV